MVDGVTLEACYFLDMRYFHLDYSGGPTASHCCQLSGLDSTTPGGWSLLMPSGGTFSSCDQLPIHPRDSFLDPGYSTNVGKYVECPPPLGSEIMAIPT